MLHPAPPHKKPQKMPKLFLVHWDDSKIEAYADTLRELGWEVEHEAMDGSLAYRRVKEWQPDVIVIDLRYLPAHGRMTGMIMKKSPTSWEIPIIFVGGTPEAIVKAQEDVFDARFVSQEELPQALEAYKAEQ
jgi:CheY-like chemotaxis protein